MAKTGCHADLPEYCIPGIANIMQVEKNLKTLEHYVCELV